MKKYAAYIFDVDGTIFATAPGILRALTSALVKCDLQFDPAQISDKLIGPKLPEMIDLLHVTDDAAVKQQIIAEFRRVYDENPGFGVTIYDGAQKLIDSLVAQSARMFVATNKPIASVTRLFDLFNLHCFADVFCPDKYVGRTLTKAEMLTLISTQYNIDPQNMLMIGDTDNDMRAAMDAGCAFAFASWGYAADADKLRQMADVVLG